MKKAIIEVGKAWGIKSQHSEWSDEETLEHFANDIIKAITPKIFEK